MRGRGRMPSETVAAPNSDFIVGCTAGRPLTVGLTKVKSMTFSSAIFIPHSVSGSHLQQCERRRPGPALCTFFDRRSGQPARRANQMCNTLIIEQIRHCGGVCELIPPRWE